MSAMVTLKHENGLKQKTDSKQYINNSYRLKKNAIKIIHHGPKNKTSPYVADEKYIV